MAKYVISQVTMPDGNIVELKDKVARDAVKGGTFFIGTTETEIEDESTASAILVDGNVVEVGNGMIVFSGAKEFIFSSVDGKWHEIGDNTNLGSLATKNSATGAYIPGGTVSRPTFSGNDISYTPTGLVSRPGINVSVETDTINELVGSGSVTAGTAAQAELPEMGFTYDSNNQHLTLSWSSGSFMPNTPTSVSLPTTREKQIITNVGASLDSDPTFTGNPTTMYVSGTVSQPTFTGTPATIIVE